MRSLLLIVVVLVIAAGILAVIWQATEPLRTALQQLP